MRPRVRQVESVPRQRAQRTPPQDPTPIVPEPAAVATGRHVTSSDGIGRLPMIGLDEGAIKGTRPDRLY